MRKKLKDVCMFYSGTGFPIQYQGQTKGEYPFYKVGDIANNAIAGKIYLELCNNYISSDVAKMIKGCILPKDTVVFAKIGEALKLNRRAITSCDCLIDNNAMGIAPKLDSLRIQYFYFCMKNLKMQTLAESTTVPSVRKTVLEKYEIEVPSLVEQEEIEKKLTLTQKIIEKRRQELSYLDEIIKARFVEMFNLSDCIYKSLGECTDFVDYRGHTPELSDEGIIRMVNAKSVGKGFFKYVDEFVTEETYDAWMHRGFGYPGDILFVTEGHTFGNTCLIPEDMTKFALGQRVITIKGKEEIKNAFLCSYMQTDMFWKDINVYRTGGTAQGIRSKDLVKVMVPIPPIEQQIEFVRFVHKVDKSKVVEIIN